ncbi:MAG: DNA polymerase, partial [Oscillospiraceae bacterium]|nr:DNA polymerase [Oscillospiraceae bacterium]
AKTSVKKYYAMRGCVCADGRARGQIQFYGANRTGRFSGRLIQLQNLKKNKMKGLDVARAIVRRGDYDGFAMIYDASQAVLSELVRTACVPKPGCKFIVADFSSIERVVLAWLAGEQWVLDYYAAGKDLYLATAAQMFRLNLDDLKKEDPVRGLGKLADLACGYGGSVGAMERFGALEMGLKPEELPGLVRKWRDANPRIEQYWWDIDKAAMACVRKKQSTAVRNIRFHYKGGMMFIELPSGRVLSYAKPYTTTNKFDSPAIGYWGLNDKNHWGRIESYGPKLCENITQAISRDLLCQALVNLDAAGHRTVMHVHDEAVVEAPLAIPDEEVISLMTDPLPSWAVGLPLRAAGYSGVFYFKD